MLKILGRKNSSNVQKVLWACHELGVTFEREDVGGPFGRNQEPEYLALNPNGRVPTIIEDGFVLWESNAIVRYLAMKHGGALLPGELRERALAEQWMDWQQTAVSPAITPVFWGLVRTPPAERDEPAIARARDALEASMIILDARLGASEYVAGPRFSMGDIPLGVMVYRWYEMDIPRQPLSHLKRWYDLLAARRGFQQHVMIGLT